jgi:ABC-type transport system involved in cytochrome bd biosynthesis fused ATPase/permease subunit
MKLAGFLLLLSGWGIAMTAIAVLPSPPSRLGFFLAGVVVEAIGLALAVRAHIPVREDRG